MAAAWQNADGLQVPFGNFWSDAHNFANKARAVVDRARVMQAVMYIDLTLIPTGTVAYTSDLNNDGTLDGFNDGDFRLPANASVLSAVFIGTEAAAGGTSFTVGTYQKNGTAVAATGLVTATEGVTANVGVGKRIFGAGSLVSATAGTAGVGTANVYIGVGTTGTFTAGKGVLIVEYIEQPTAEAVAD